MARVTVEDCLKMVDNRFQLIHLAAKRVEQLRKGAKPLYECKNKEVVLALREVASGEVMPGRPGEELPPIEYLQPELPEVYEEEEEEFEAEAEVEAEAEPEGEVAASAEEPEEK
jgi:DNA-directed RNA polymerase subunit omega